ncbi:MAG TPA: hypothetical protein VM369_04945 [Candidatus Binatia bacterium]|nr:hypothetical protein [Candidatus Binatia bacterium]
MRIDMEGCVPAWPVGARLRFRLDAPVQEKYRFVRGTDVEILGPPKLCPPNDAPEWAVRQPVWSFAMGRDGWAKYDQLEPRPDDAAPAKLEEVKLVRPLRVGEPA